MSVIPDETPPETPPHVEAIDDLARTALALRIERSLLKDKLSNQAVGGVVFVLAITLPCILFLPKWAAVGAAVVTVLFYYGFTRNLVRRMAFFADARANLLETFVAFMRNMKIVPNSGQVAELIQAATPQPITDPKDQAVWDIINKDRSLTDDQVSGQIAGKNLGFTLGREAVNNRRNRLIAMGYSAKRQV